MELADSTFNAGAAKVDITPPLGTIINGDFRAHYARYIHDPLFAKAIVLKKGSMMAAIVVIDICVMPKTYADQIRNEVSLKTGIAFASILISCTHTHAAGSVAEAYLSSVDAAYSKKIPGLIVEAVKQAIEKMRPAKMAFGGTDVPEHVLSRRYFMNKGYTPRSPVTGNQEGVKTNPFGAESCIRQAATITDPGVSYLAIKGIDDKWISLLANYSLHYVGDWENGTISADYFGEFSAGIQRKLDAGNDFVGMMSNGTSGDINIWDFSNPGRYPSGHFEKSKLIGEDIAERVFQSLKHLSWEVNPDLDTRYEELDIATRKPSAEELEQSKKIVAESNYETLIADEDGLRKIYAREQILLNEYPEAIQFPLQVIKIGTGLIGGLAAEIFAETGLWLKNHSPAERYFSISLANGNCGYVPPSAAFELGGYETWRSRTSYLETNAEMSVRNRMIGLMKKFY
jgi:neutral ceramidase